MYQNLKKNWKKQNKTTQKTKQSGRAPFKWLPTETLLDSDVIKWLTNWSGQESWEEIFPDQARRN